MCTLLLPLVQRMALQSLAIAGRPRRCRVQMHQSYCSSISKLESSSCYAALHRRADKMLQDVVKVVTELPKGFKPDCPSVFLTVCFSLCRHAE